MMRQKLTQQEFINRGISVHKNKFDYSKVNYTHTKAKVVVICNNCGYENSVSPNSHLQGNGCPGCKVKKGEEKIKQFFDKYQINYENQKRFKHCKFKKRLRFDFYIPELNLCIEYDGQQHFQSVEYFGGQKQFEQNLLRDKAKETFCQQNYIKLLRIPYTELKNIDQILEREILGVQGGFAPLGVYL